MSPLLVVGLISGAAWLGLGVWRGWRAGWFERQWLPGEVEMAEESNRVARLLYMEEQEIPRHLRTPPAPRREPPNDSPPPPVEHCRPALEEHHRIQRAREEDPERYNLGAWLR